MAAYGLYTHIASNKFRSMLLLAGLFVLVYVMVYRRRADRRGHAQRRRPGRLLPRGRVRATSSARFPMRPAAPLLWIVIAYFFHQSMIDAVTGGEDVTRQAAAAALQSPGKPLHLARHPDAEAEDHRDRRAQRLRQRAQREAVFRHGHRGLLDALDDQEIEAVLGHELTHIRNGDVRMMVIAVIIAGVIGFFAELFFRAFIIRQRRHGGWRRARPSSSSGGERRAGAAARIAIVIAVALIALAWLLSLVVRLRAVAHARVSRRCRLGRADQEPRRHDLGAAQDRGPRRACGRDLGGDGNVRRQPARGVCRPVRDPSFGASAGRRRWCSTPAGTIPGRLRCRRICRAGRTIGSRRRRIAQSRRHCRLAHGATATLPAPRNLPPKALGAIRRRARGDVTET